MFHPRAAETDDALTPAFSLFGGRPGTYVEDVSVTATAPPLRSNEMPAEIRRRAARVAKRGEVRVCQKRDYAERVGLKYSALTIVAVITSKMCQCRCDCGKTHRVRIDNLKNGMTKSCGCLTRTRHGERLRRDLEVLGQQRLAFSRLVAAESARTVARSCASDRTLPMFAG